MSTDKEEFALYCEAKMTKSENVWELKVVFTGLQQKNYLLPSPAALPQWMTTIMMKTTLKNPFASIYPL
ncbi:exodeoxyribonuclease VIII [Escherichia coli]|nr:exodeoxyribonuclease VIII [Escherichia coli]